MRIPIGCHTRIMRLPSGKKYLAVLDASNRLVERIPMRDRLAGTRTGRKLRKLRRRIGIR